MNKLFSSGIASAFALGVVALASSPAQAACLNAGCTDFDPTTATPVTYSQFTGGIASSSVDRIEVIFSSTGTFNTPFLITGISLSAPGLAGSQPIADLNYTGSPTSSAALTFTGAAGFKNFANATLNFVLPSGVTAFNSGGTFSASLRYFSSTTANFAESETNFTTTAQNAVPGPLPIVGAGAAFGFSRKLRRRVAKAV